MDSWLHNISTRRLIQIVSLFIFIFITSLSGYGYYKYQQNEDSVKLTISYHNQTIKLQELRYHSAQVQQFLTDASLTGDAESIQEAKSHQDAMTALLPTLPDIDLSDIKTLLVSQLDVGQKMVQAYANDKSEGDRLMKKPDTGFDAVSSRIQTSIDAALKIQNEKMETQELSSSVSMARENTIQLFSSALLLVISLVSFGLVSIKVNRPLLQLKTKLHDLTTGKKDLRFRLPVNGSDEFSTIASDFNQFLNELDHIVSTVQNVSVRTGHQMSSLMSLSKETMDDMSQVQMSSDSLATATQEMSATIHEIAGITDTAKKETEETQRQANNGQAEVTSAVVLIQNVASEIEKAVSSINDLEQQSTQIGEILNVIKTISEQTNLLALNAAIEAARAGEAGRGFAVVADEVRHLATRTQQATVEIRQRIELLQQGTSNSVETMNNTAQISGQAVQQAEAAGERLNDIVLAVGRIADMNVQIATAAEEQSYVAQETAQNVEQIAAVIRTATDDARKSYRFSQQVSLNSEEAKMLASQFKVTYESTLDSLDHNEVVRWSDAFRVGIAEVDNQHLGLFNSMNKLYHGIINEMAPGQVQERLNELVFLAKKHLEDEESLMLRANYSDLNAHKQVHVKLLSDMDNLLRRFANKEAGSDMELLFFLKNWLVDHIFRVDKRYVPELKAAGM
nr:bacteriohemerythrin [uncultured Tolumonas sp.]